MKQRKRVTFIKKRVKVKFVSLSDPYEVSEPILRPSPYGFLDQVETALARGITKLTVADSNSTAFSILRHKIARQYINNLLFN